MEVLKIILNIAEIICCISIIVLLIKERRI